MQVTTRARECYGSFGNLSHNYSKARRGFPEEVINYILSKLDSKHPHILDIGCGTGLATEQLQRQGASVTGTDIDSAMIKQAQASDPLHITYIVAPANHQPFADNEFDAVTAFSAFHWFSHRAALDEIRRALKPDGTFFAVNKNEAGDFKEKNRAILRQFITGDMPDAKQYYSPKKILQESDFKENEEVTFPVSEFFTIDEALRYVQSMSIWNLVSKEARNIALETLREHFTQTVQNERVERKLNVTVISGKLVI